jgi:hypothetical protein
LSGNVATDALFDLLDEEADFQCLIKTIKSEFCAFKELRFHLTFWNAARASLLIDALRSPSCKLEGIQINIESDVFSSYKKWEDVWNVDVVCLELSRLNKSRDIKMTLKLNVSSEYRERDWRLESTGSGQHCRQATRFYMYCGHQCGLATQAAVRICTADNSADAKIPGADCFM